jgi:pyruvate kinase
MALHYGVIPQEMAPPQDVASLVHQVDELVRSRDLAPEGSRIVIVAGSSLGTPSTLNGIIIHTVGETWKTATNTSAEFAAAVSQT